MGLHRMRRVHTRKGALLHLHTPAASDRFCLRAPAALDCDARINSEFDSAVDTSTANQHNPFCLTDATQFSRKNVSAINEWIKVGTDSYRSRLNCAGQVNKSAFDVRRSYRTFYWARAMIWMSFDTVSEWCVWDATYANYRSITLGDDERRPAAQTDREY